MIKKILIFAVLFFSTLVQSQHTDSIKTATYFISKGNKNLKKQNFEQSIKNYLEALKILENEKDSIQLIKVYTNIGVLNARLKNFDKAIIYLQKSLSHIKKEDNLKLQVLFNIAGLYTENRDITSSLKINQEAETLAKKLNNEAVLSNIYNNFSLLYNRLKEYPKSIEYGEKSLLLKEKLKLSPEITINNIGYSYLLNKQYKNAILYFNKIKSTKNKSLQRLVLNNLKDAHKNLREDNTALNYANHLLKLKDSLYKAEQKVKVASLVEKFESEKKQQQIDVLHIKNQLQQIKINNQKNIFIVLFIIVLLVSILIYLWFKNQKTKQSLRQASLKHKLLQTQLNPHFLFHSLNSIQSFIYQNKKEESLNYLSSYSKLMRSIFDSASTDFISIKEEANTMNSYLELQKVNFNEDTVFLINVDSNIEHFLIPPMFIQPYVENAIQHGIKNIKNGKVEITYSNYNNLIKVIIFDNGKGINTSNNNNQLLEHSTSSSVLKSRIKNLEKTHSYSIKTSIKSNDNGTIITLLFPKKTSIYD
ncbi:hypothetical protein DS884_04515 [Tenacibaculum sp. E3R01]|uniref:tetratricopeptide repeat-containing sensor histidine kinase n=1 Tax=Tenacibaculum sp. E3R01 TaxID=2267227 RepID=UPI000DE8AE0B|nr:histidine kinase [Tenacibaculum sp. E3R01]RBW60845.1 hypothetical protein DS884_04515 [Tenacibaculum sp. E3R01]